MYPLFIPLGPAELGIIFIMLVFILGPKKIPQLSRSIGESIGYFKTTRSEIEAEMEELEGK